MKMRNWLGLGRKLVDQYDMDSTVQWIQQQLGYLTLSYWGFGVQQTTQFPSPFPVGMASGALTGSVGPGIAFDPNGQLIQVLSDSATSKVFAFDAGDSSQPRWDLLCVRYAQGQDTLIQKPSDPRQTVYLNLHDDFQIVVRKGTPGATPAYPAKVAGDVILAGLRVPAGATVGSQVFVDLSVRDLAQAAAIKVPAVRQETLTGAVDDSNQTFTLSLPPISAKSVIVFVDSLALQPTEFVASGQTVTLVDAPKLGQTVSAYYIANSAGSASPLAGYQETPTGDVDGVNQTFSLEGLPADQRSTVVFVDGMQVPPSDWSLVQGNTNGSILFSPDAVPQQGQILSVFYFVNPGTVGVAPASAGGGSTSPGTGSGTQHVEYPTLTPTDITNGYVSLLSLPATPETVLLDLIGTSAQVYGSDFTVAGQHLIFQGPLASGGNAPLEPGNRLRIVYWN